MIPARRDSVLISIRVTPAEKAALDRVAAENECSLSGWIRGLCGLEINRTNGRPRHTRAKCADCGKPFDGASWCDDEDICSKCGRELALEISAGEPEEENR